MWTSCMKREIVSGCYLHRIYRFRRDVHRLRKSCWHRLQRLLIKCSNQAGSISTTIKQRHVTSVQTLASPNEAGSAGPKTNHALKRFINYVIYYPCRKSQPAHHPSPTLTVRWGHHLAVVLPTVCLSPANISLHIFTRSVFHPANISLHIFTIGVGIEC